MCSVSSYFQQITVGSILLSHYTKTSSQACIKTSEHTSCLFRVQRKGSCLSLQADSRHDFACPSSRPCKDKNMRQVHGYFPLSGSTLLLTHPCRVKLTNGFAMSMHSGVTTLMMRCKSSHTEALRKWSVMCDRWAVRSDLTFLWGMLIKKLELLPQITFFNLSTQVIMQIGALCKDGESTGIIWLCTLHFLLCKQNSKWPFKLQGLLSQYMEK